LLLLKFFNGYFLIMKWFWLLLLVPVLSFSQNKTKPIIDSVDYYIQLANFNKKTNNYKFSLLSSQKALDYAKSKKDKKSQAVALFSLGQPILR